MPTEEEKKIALENARKKLKLFADTTQLEADLQKILQKQKEQRGRGAEHG